jgi:phosphatidylserine/phosphatidylglycerophosphate/cardiolipin synthase-like enzyme
VVTLRPESVWTEATATSTGLLVDARTYYRELYAAAQNARRYILLSGWQFDSQVALLRGDDAARARAEGRPVALLEVLKDLCVRKPELEILILAWDFHGIFAIEREWLQKVIFHWRTNPRLRFQFDSNHVPKGCHHQKFVVVDGELSFLGGLDVCDHRWDDRSHLAENPMRFSRGAAHQPFHDIQAYIAGREPAAKLTELFACRWSNAGGDTFEVPAPPAEPGFESYAPEGALPLATNRIALSRTDPHGAPTNKEGCCEIHALVCGAIAAAEELIYIETQYLSSRHVKDALVERMRAAGRSKLDIVIVLNKRGENIKEQVAVGLAQAKVLGELRDVARETGHALGLFFTVPAGGPPAKEGEDEVATYIHAKLLVVDDRLLSIGSANLTNRSFGVDTELNLTVEDDAASGALSASIRRARRSLLAEHLGDDRGLPEGAAGLVGYLDARATAKDGRLRQHPSPTEGERTAFEVVDPQALPFDPAEPETMEHDRGLFTNGLGAFWQKLVSNRDDTK